MSSEIFNYYQQEESIVDENISETAEDLEYKSPEADEEIESSDFFDLDSFFDEEIDEEKTLTTNILNKDEQPNILEAKTPTSDLLMSLQEDSNESITTLNSRVSAETFAAGASLASGVFSALQSIVGSCGVVCAHSLTSLAKIGNPLGVTPGLGNLNMPGFNINSNGFFNLSGDIDSLSNATGFSKKDLLSGKYSAEEILMAFFSSFGESISMMFGFGLVGGIVNGLFDAFLPTPQVA